MEHKTVSPYEVNDELTTSLLLSTDIGTSDNSPVERATSTKTSKLDLSVSVILFH